MILPLFAGAGLAAAGAVVGSTLASRRPWLLSSEMPRSVSVETDDLGDFPAEADVVVIGGGIAGISTALFLNEFGVKVVVLEKGYVGGEASSRNFGWVYTNAFDEDTLPLAVESKRIWLSLAARFGFDVSVRQSGNTMLLGSEEEVEMMDRWAQMARERFPNDVDATIVRGPDLDHIVPRAGARYTGALHQPSDGTAEPPRATPLIAKGARAEGVKIFAPVAVRSIETQGGAVHSVVTERGEVRTSHVVLAGGSCSRLFLGNLGIDLPVQLIASPLLRVSGGTAGPGAGAGADFAWRQQADGSVTIGVNKHVVPVTLDSFRVLRSFLPAMKQTMLPPGKGLLSLRFGRDFFESFGAQRSWKADEITPFERTRLLTARPLQAALDRNLANARAFFPELRGARVTERWGGVIDASPDSTSIISEVPQIPGLVVNTGHTAHGFTLGPGAGKLTAEIVTGRPTTVDPAIFRFSRFTDGTRLTIREFI